MERLHLLDPLLIAIILGFAFWWTIVYSLNRAGILKKFNITAYGPLIMWRTYRGQKFLDLLSSPKNLWKVLITACIPMVFFSMVLMLLMIIVVDIVTLINTPTPGPIYAPQNILAIPGVNQFIPFAWGWIALIVAMVVHEFGHAIMAKAENIKVKSLGLMLIPIPIGAFAEIDEEEMFGTKPEGGASEILGPMDTKAAGQGPRKASSMALVRILSAGVISNFLVAIIAFALLFGPVLGAIGASDSQMVVVNVGADTPASQAGIKNNMILKTVNGASVNTSGEFNAMLRTLQGTNATIGGLQGDRQVSYTVPVKNISGIYILGVLDDYPGAKAGLEPGMQLVSINGTPVRNSAEYTSYMANTTGGQFVTLGVIDKTGISKDISLNLATGSEPKGYIGFSGGDLSDNSIGLAVGTFAAKNHLSSLQNMLSPVGNTLSEKVMNVVGGILLVWFLPVWEVTGGAIGFNVFQSDLSGLYYPIGWATPLGDGIFYLTLTLFWIGWLNVNIAVFNCLPMIPLDGGHIFREVTRLTIGRFIKDDQKVERLSKSIVNVFAIVLFSSLVFMIVAPYIVHGIL